MRTSSSPVARRNRRDRRPADPRPMRETERDQAIVRLVYDYRILSQAQLQRLARKSRSTVQQALVRLYHHRYLERVFLPVAYGGSSPTLYILDTRGIALLQRMGVEDFSGMPSRNLSGVFLEHTLAMNDFRITVSEACERLGWRIAVWRTENALKANYDRVTVRTRGKVEAVPIVPDSYFVVDIPGRGVSHFFLELDRATMTLRRFKTKIAGYVAYYKSGAYQRRFGAQGFRVLTVVDAPGTVRVENLVKESASIPGVGRRFWFAHLPELTPERVLTGPVWRIGGHASAESLFTL